MSVLDVLTRDRVSIANRSAGCSVADKDEALRMVSTMLASGQRALDESCIHQVLVERERLQSTGVGGGVAVPHGSMEALDRQLGALLLCPQPIAFEAIDGEPVTIIFALVGPRTAPADHLRLLARMSRLLRVEAFRQQLLGAGTGEEAYAAIAAAERGTS